MIGLVTMLVLATTGAVAEGAAGATAARMLPARTVISPEDIHLSPGVDPQAYIGKETRYAIFMGRPILETSLAQPALVERNQIVTVIYQAGGLNITAEARALDRAAAGDSLQLLNQQSRSVIYGTVLIDGRVLVRSQ